AEHDSIATGYQHVDAACIHLVERPSIFDVIVTDNLFGDILTDLAGAVCGGIGYAASANLHPGAVSMFEPVHGAAHDIAGTGRANPVAAVASAALMLEHLGEVEAAERIAKAVQSFVEDAAPTGGTTRGSKTPVSQTTAAIGDAIAERL
ncbi:MAG: isocitrate/isopropylmalate family dehydrogenase, partial [Acidimicrobiales bacterium]